LVNRLYGEETESNLERVVEEGQLNKKKILFGIMIIVVIAGLLDIMFEGLVYQLFSNLLAK
jgi:hypothetical protein